MKHATFSSSRLMLLCMCDLAVEAEDQEKQYKRTKINKYQPLSVS